MTHQVELLLQLCRERGLKLRTAESCTAGAVAAAIAAVPGASDVLDRGWITYSNEAKCEELNVAPSLIREHGAVSREVVSAMVEGGVSEQAVCVAVSGIAGPDGGSDEKPVGTVWIAVCLPGGKPLSKCSHFSGSRRDIQAAAVSGAIEMLLCHLNVG
ncbi:MAG: CinA family protein [Mariprofundaceae bacterium]|nr:CinA family protein [Mariprofundaceae bacterium]